VPLASSTAEPTEVVPSRNVIAPLGTALAALAPATLADSRTGDPVIPGFGDAVIPTEGARSTGAWMLSVVEPEALSPFEATILQPSVTVPGSIPCVVKSAVLPFPLTEPLDAV
jgi:hypothetical protein